MIPIAYLGIDPGNSGGAALLNPDGSVAGLFKFEGLTETDLRERVSGWYRQYNLIALIELVGPNRNRSKGEVRQGASAMFSFGQSYGFLRGLSVGLAIPFEEVLPIEWQAAFRLRGKADETKTAKKNRHKAKAQQLFPAWHITHATADALLIAEYARRKATGQLVASSEARGASKRKPRAARPTTPNPQ